MEIFQKIPILIFFFFMAIGAYILVYLLRNRFSKERYTNLCERIKTWLIIIVIFYLGSSSHAYSFCCDIIFISNGIF